MFANTEDAGLIFPIYSIFLLSLVFFFLFFFLSCQLRAATSASSIPQ